MNLIPVIREALGLKENEEFSVRCGTAYMLGRYRFTKDRLEHFNVRDNCWEGTSSDLFAKLVHGIYRVDKPPFKPNEGDLYYFIDLDNGDAIGTSYYSIIPHHKLRVESGNCYRTQKEAEKHLDEWMTKVYGKDWGKMLEKIY